MMESSSLAPQPARESHVGLAKLRSAKYHELKLRSKRIQTILGNRIVSHNTEKETEADFSGPGKLIGLYFSAGWCEECSSFTPLLLNFYKNVHEQKEQQPELEIIYVSCDADEHEFEAAYKQMPWLALVLDEMGREEIMQRFDVAGLPTLIFIDGESGDEVFRNGCQMVREDPKAERFSKWNRG